MALLSNIHPYIATPLNYTVVVLQAFKEYILRFILFRKKRHWHGGRASGGKRRFFYGLHLFASIFLRVRQRVLRRELCGETPAGPQISEETRRACREQMINRRPLRPDIQPQFSLLLVVELLHNGQIPW